VVRPALTVTPVSTIRTIVTIEVTSFSVARFLLVGRMCADARQLGSSNRGDNGNRSGRRLLCHERPQEPNQRPV
jgi:hypothetical protein